MAIGNAVFQVFQGVSDMCKSMFQMFQLCQMYVSSVSYRCCKSRSGCCICCNDCTCMLQVSAPNVSSIFLDLCCKCVYLDVAYVSHICCNCFIWMLYMFAIVFQVFSRVFAYVQAHVSNVSSISYVCCNCFIWMFQN